MTLSTTVGIPNGRCFTSSGIQNSLSKYEPLQALCEYIWNGFDAQASIINISMSPNEMGVAATLSISDNGTGIDRNNLESKFKPIYESEKTYQYDPNIKHSHTKGKNGVGRLTFFKFAESAEWETIYEHDGNHYRYLIQMNQGVNPDNIITIELDLARDIRYRNPLELASYVRSIVEKSTQQFYLFVDEIQSVEKFEMVTEFDEALWGSMVEKVTVFEDGLVFTLTSGEDVRVAPC